MSASDKLVEDMMAEIEKSYTTQKYQAVADILHYEVGMAKEEIFEDSATADKYLDSPVGYHRVARTANYWRSEKEEIKALEEDLNRVKRVNSKENIKKLTHWANKEALSKSFLRVLEKFKIDPKSSQAREIFEVLKNVYNLDASDEVLQENINQLKKFLIIARLDKKLKFGIPSNKKGEVEKIISDYIQTGNLKRAMDDLKRELGDELDRIKLEKILTKFPILRKIESPAQVRERVKNETVGEIHAGFAKEVELLTQVERLAFEGDEVLYRGIPKTALSREDIISGFDKIHRAMSTAGSVAAHQIKTNWNRIFHPEFGEMIGSNATASSSDPSIAIKYAGNRHDNSPGDKQGWVFEIRPKKGQTAVALANYEQRGGKYSEFDFSQVDPNEIFAVHLITKRQNGTTIVEESISNPYYKKRENERGLGKTVGQDVFFRPGNNIETDENGKITVQGANHSEVHDPKQLPAYVKHIQGKKVQDGSGLDQSQIRERRKQRQAQNETYQEKLKAKGFSETLVKTVIPTNAVAEGHERKEQREQKEEKEQTERQEIEQDQAVDDSNLLDSDIHFDQQPIPEEELEKEQEIREEEIRPETEDESQEREELLKGPDVPKKQGVAKMSLEEAADEGNFNDPPEIEEQQSTFGESQDSGTTVSKPASLVPTSLQPEKNLAIPTKPSVGSTSSFQYRLRSTEKLGDLVKIATKGPVMNQNKFSKTMEKWEEVVEIRSKSNKIEDLHYKDVTYKNGKTTVPIHNKVKPDEIVHSYEKDCPMVRVTNPPDDRTLFLFAESSVAIAPLTLTEPCNNLETALKLMEVSAICGVEIRLHDKDMEAIEVLKSKDDKNAQRIEMFENMSKDPELRKQFLEKMGNKPFELGKTPLPDGLMPSIITMVSKNKPPI